MVKFQSLTSFLQEYMPNRAHKYRGRMGLAIFDLGLVCNFCPNPDCAVDLQGEGVTCSRHVGSLTRRAFVDDHGTVILAFGRTSLALSIFVAFAKMFGLRLNFLKTWRIPVWNTISVFFSQRS